MNNMEQEDPALATSHTETVMDTELQARKQALEEALQDKEEIPKGQENWSASRRKAYKWFHGNACECVLAVVILANFGAIAAETDLKASDENARIPKWLSGLNVSFLVFYTLEFCVRLFIERSRIVCEGWNWFDFMIVSVGIISHVAEGDLGGGVAILRTARLVRLLKMVRLIQGCDELWALVRGMMGCLRTLLWAFCLVFMILTVFAIVAVTVIHPYMEDITNKGRYETCDWCPGAFSSVLHANLTLFQVLSGDGWGTFARPIIEEYPVFALYFILVIFTFGFGIVNLVTAVIVDSSQQARVDDMAEKAAERETVQKAAQQKLLHVCRMIDEDGSGTITLDELEQGVDLVPEFAQLLRLMDISKEDLGVVFSILDEDGSGDVTHEEFAEQLWKLKSQDKRTMLMFLKQYVMQTQRMLEAYIKSRSMSSPSNQSLSKLSCPTHVEDKSPKPPNFLMGSQSANHHSAPLGKLETTMRGGLDIELQSLADSISDGFAELKHILAGCCPEAPSQILTNSSPDLHGTSDTNMHDEDFRHMGPGLANGERRWRPPPMLKAPLNPGLLLDVGLATATHRLAQKSSANSVQKHSVEDVLQELRALRLDLNHSCSPPNPGAAAGIQGPRNMSPKCCNSRIIAGA